MIAGARVEVAPYKRNPMDFVLWKPSDGDQPGWDSPWGRGRPGWHIECSAMSYELLGESFDIHGGGNDLMFPHHENEIAQSCCAHPEGDFARYWLHNEMLQVEGKKMSKSLGNFFTVHDLLTGNNPEQVKYPGEVIRLVFLSTHYRKPMDWTAQKARNASEELGFWANTLSTLSELDWLENTQDAVDPLILDALAEDLNTSLVISLLQKMAREIDKRDSFAELGEREQFEKLQTFTSSAQLVGFDIIEMAKFRRDKPPLKDLEDFKLTIAYERVQAKETKDFSKVDQLKAALVEAGVEVRMSKDGVDLVPGPDFDPTKLKALK
jgi:cysteinyl-tRNA synthetase